jgi:hypothetical protein
MKTLTKNKAKKKVLRYLEIGARNSAYDQKLIQEIHDAACVLGAFCHKDNVPGAVQKMTGTPVEPMLEAVPAKYKGLDFSPPKGVQDAAMRGLALRKKFKRGGLDTQQAGKTGIGSGVARATTLANGGNVSPDVIKKMVAFFARHEKNKNSTTPNGEPGAGKIAWLLWGGEPGKRWANKLNNQMKTIDRKAESLFRGLTNG